jgi:cyclopropane fatty-acyl-phospholipid synthase-like methyltransferase
VTGRDWEAWWNQVPAQMPDLYHQVGRTVGGRANGEADLVATSEAIISTLQLSGSEAVLDLCCGNGLLTKRIAPQCRTLIGVDYSASLIDIAQRTNAGRNITYVVSDVVAISPRVIGMAKVEAVYLASALQYFDATTTGKLLRRLRALATQDFRFVIEGIPDKAKFYDFYNTPERLRDYLTRKAEGTEHIATWWSQSTLDGLAQSHGFNCTTIAQDSNRFCAHYRFDALLSIADG